jgi:hypothetical protein
MITLNEIAYNIKNLAYGGKYSSESSISIKQIKHWIHYHRAKIIVDNIDKGITNDNNIYQRASLTWYNSTLRMFSRYGGFQGTYGYYNQPYFPNGGHTYEWVPYSSLTYEHEPYNSQYGQGRLDMHGRNYYGIETRKSEMKGDFRNYGWMSFYIPETIQLKDDRGIKKVAISRTVFAPKHDVTTITTETVDGVETSTSTTITVEPDISNYTDSIELYRKDSGSFDQFNKFTNNNTPNYEQYRTLLDSTLTESYQFGGNMLKLNNLQVSPLYLRDKIPESGGDNILFKYRGEASLILENPTHIDNVNGVRYETNEQRFDDGKVAYPIPMEYVSDLIQRVLQIEIQTELKTTSENVNDGLDDNVKLKTVSGGPQVQR